MRLNPTLIFPLSSAMKKNAPYYRYSYPYDRHFNLM
ncbi:hypothetical protein SPAB_02717 [Salmonella enterica subsp. enterica serovar Paratyphi B str. SPB7]|uniref:Uncharacterized protein n=1 Tax=Salmonella paratyphi B (strain ATCC BAA-1250 / SPB7) TaxID=1016998 RepID=A0A6C6Z479_SALPB|nr:hypothetical protein SPAB_02717 [Salmonella enterica subsp. enterica serovar Paratyphi B str. SPB7]